MKVFPLQKRQVVAPTCLDEVRKPTLVKWAVTMKIREVLVRPKISQVELHRVLGAWSERHDAELKPMGRLVRDYMTLGENMHWHISGRTRGMGTVEVSYIPSKGRLMVLVHDNRQGFWAGEAYESLAEEMKRLLGVPD